MSCKTHWTCRRCNADSISDGGVPFEEHVCSSDYNKVPDGWREITEEQFAQGQFFTYEAEAVEFRQFHPSPIKDEKGHPLLDARLWHYWDGTGIGMMHDFWAGKVRFFAFGCDHDFEHIRNEGRCLNRYKCKKCGHENLIDSSD